MAKKIHKVPQDPIKSYFVYKHGIHVYPVSEFEADQKNREYPNYDVIKYRRWYVEVSNNGVKKRFEKIVKNDELEDAIWATINYYWKLLEEKKQTQITQISTN